ncbi:MAG: acyl-CoA dehydrogenase family protein, partial [Pseudomonadota bacterium]
MNAPAKITAKDAPELSRFSWEDAFLMEDQLSEDDRMLRDGAAQFASAELAPRVIAAYRDETVAPELFAKMGEAGLLGVTVPEAYGGLGASYTAYGLIAREIERIDSGYRSMMSVQSSLVIYPIYAYGSEEQRQKY